MRFAVLPIAALLLLLPAAACAHELQVVPVGGVELDAGTAEPPRLIHATLDGADDELVVTVAGTGTPLEVLLLVPDRKPESGWSGGERPTLQVAGISARLTDEDAALADEATAIEYRTVQGGTLAPPEGSTVTLRVRRGSEPTRVALRIGAPTSFEAANVQSTPRTLVRVRAWNDTPAPSSSYEPPAPKTTDRTLVALFGAGVSLLAVLIGVWWVWSGRRRSRERGVERALAERADQADRDA